ncbi:MAG: DUF2911 domain-containing protein [Flavisolibacter sp.]
MLKKLIACAILSYVLNVANAQTIKTPAPSPTQTIKQDFGIGSIELSYSRPGIKGRKLGVDIAPYGLVWRTGANQATTVSFSDTVSIGGTVIAPGKYGFVSIPNKDQWTLILTKQLNVTAPNAYKEENDVVRVVAKPVLLKDPVETFTMQFANVKPTTTDLQLMWDNVLVSLPISMDIDSRIMADIKKTMASDPRPYFQAGMYYLDNNKDLNQAITWFDKAIEQNPGGYFIYHQKANALAKLGRKDEARTAAQKSMQLAKEQKVDEYVQLNEKLIASLR